jgi:hypothetical protein
VIPGQFLSAKIAFFFFAIAWLCFMGAALLPEGRRRPAWLGRGNLIGLGLAFAVAPMMYVYFKAGFHPAPYFH